MGDTRRKTSQKGRQASASQRRPRRQPLDDNYYYEEPYHRGGSRSSGEFQDVSSFSSPERRKKDQRKKGKGEREKGHKKAAVALVVVLLLVGGGLWYVFGYLLNGLTFNSLDKNALGITDTGATGVKNIALFGLDSRDDVDEGRSDALMVLSIDHTHHKLKLTSILRDSKVYIDEVGNDKITHAYAYGGPELAIHTLNQNFKLNIDDYVTVNFFQMARIVDAFGGTRVNITYEEAEEINTNLAMLAAESGDANVLESDYLYDRAGDVLLNGNQAVAYARIRHLDSDDMRASRQQNVLTGLISQMKTLSKAQYPELIRQVVPMCETSFDILDITGMTPFMLTDFTTETLSIPGTEEEAYGEYLEDGSWVYAYDLEVASQHISRFIYEEDSPYYVSNSGEE